ncbi:MAG: hypothetical protein ACXVIO_04865, partial [Candidatus Angelobacter sp.]
MKQARTQSNLATGQWRMFVVRCRTVVRWKTAAVADCSAPRVPLIWSVLLSALMAPAAYGQTPIEALHVPELEAGFQLLYELKPTEAHAQFVDWQKA